jgi:prepilin-type N-terminal cleavage/methylation domain-containing protein
MLKERGFTLLESLIAMFLIAMILALTALLFHRSFQVLRVLDDKERTRQAARMGLDRITSELREATQISIATTDLLEFVKIDPTAEIVLPGLAPDEPPDNFMPPPYTPLIAYPNSARLLVRFRAVSETLEREVQQASGGPSVGQVVVAGVNSFNCVQNPDNDGEVDVTVSVLDGRRVTTIFSRVLCPCIRESFEI